MPITPETGGLEHVRQLTEREARYAVCPRSGRQCSSIVRILHDSPEDRIPINVISFNELNTRSIKDGTDVCTSNGGSEDVCGYELWVQWLSSIADENTVD